MHAYNKALKYIKKKTEINERRNRHIYKKLDYLIPIFDNNYTEDEKIEYMKNTISQI